MLYYIVVQLFACKLQGVFWTKYPWFWLVVEKCHSIWVFWWFYKVNFIRAFWKYSDITRLISDWLFICNQSNALISKSMFFVEASLQNEMHYSYYNYACHKQTKLESDWLLSTTKWSQSKQGLIQIINLWCNLINFILIKTS